MQIEDLCNNLDGVAIKTIRVENLRPYERLLGDKNINFKILILVRDPSRV